LFFVLPFLIWVLFIPEWGWPGANELVGAVLNSLSQALLSAVATMIGGFFLFRAMQGWLSARQLKWAEYALLLPNLVPPLFVALALLSWTPVLGDFPYGFGAVVFAHVLLNSGLVAVSLDGLVKNRLGGLASAAWVMGASPWVFWRQVAWPLLKVDLAYLFLFIFSLCFTSFALPLLLAGERTVTLEVSIFDAIRLEGRWDKAVILAALQSFFLFFLAATLSRPVWPEAPSRWSLPYLGSRGLRHWVWFPSGLLLIGWLLGAVPAVMHGYDESLVLPVVNATLTSLALGLTVGLFHLVGFLLIAYASPNPRLERFMNGYLAPSPAITGFGLLLLPVEGDIAELLLAALALTMISLPLLYRWIVHSAVAGLSRQVTVARTLGAGWSTILFEVVWPQAATKILRASGLGALWATADFAISGILLGPDMTLPMIMDNLLNNYRFESAQLLMLPLMLVGLLLYGGISGAARYVTR
jgi:thiamine transport system permease protein